MKFIMSLVLSTGCLVAQQTIELSFYKETDHFKVFCTPDDYSIANDMIKENEAFFVQLSHDFGHQYSSAKIPLNIYPDLKSVHQAINWPDAPDWLTGNHNNRTVNTVSPNNPGPEHTYHSVMKAQKSAVAIAFIDDKYNNQKHIPRWLLQGTALYKTNSFSNNQTRLLLQEISSLPTLGQLERIEEDDKAFRLLKGFTVSFSMVQFIDQRWGWDSVLNLLEDYSRFEKIFNISKEEFRDQWLEFLQNNL